LERNWQIRKKNNHLLRERIEELKKQVEEKDTSIKTLEQEKASDKHTIEKLEKQAKERESAPAKTAEPHKPETKTETKDTKSSDHKTETPKTQELKTDEKDQKAIRKSSAARPSTLPGASAGKPAPEDWLVKVNIVKGVGLRNAALFGHIDPFVEVTIQGLTSLTKTVQQTQNPEWNSKLNFFGEAGSPLPATVKLVVRDNNKYTASTLIGEKEIDLKEQWEKGTTLDTTVELVHKAKPAGKIVLQIACLFETVTDSGKPSS